MIGFGNFDERKILEMPSVALAYIGDAVYELLVRQHLVSKGQWKVKELHKGAIKLVKAGSQAKVLHQLEDRLNERELAVVRRGRNAKSGMAPKNTEMIDYRHSTAFEALIGYLYLSNQQERIGDIFDIVIDILDQKEGE